MKTTLSSIFKTVTMFFLFTLQTHDTVLGQITLLTEGFESATFPPTGWTNLQGGTGNMWTRSTESFAAGTASARYLTSTNPANAWLIFPAINMIGGVTYTITYWQRCFSLTNAENLRVTIGNSNTVAAQTTVIQTLNGLNNILFVDRTFTYTPTVSGTFYLGWNCFSGANESRLYIDAIQVTQAAAPAPTTTLSNYAANPNRSTTFAHRVGSSQSPKFTLSTNVGFNAVQIEVNTRADFTGTGLISSYTNPAFWSPSVLYDFITATIIFTERTYYVRARTSSDGGANWGAWTSTLWPYSLFVGLPYSQEGWYYTTGEQFLTGVTQESTYNFTNVVTNTAAPDLGTISLNPGLSSFNALTTDGVRENGVWSPGNNFMSIGWQNNCNGNAAIYNAFPFEVNIPQGAFISGADFSVVSTTDCACQNQNVNMSLVFDAERSDNAPVPTLTSVADLTNRTVANQPILYLGGWANNTRYSMLAPVNILQEIINRPGWVSGNNFNLFARWDLAVTPGANNNRCIRQANNGTATAPRLDVVFTNFKNTIYFPPVNRNIYGPSANSWRWLRLADNTVCTGCYIEYRIHNATNNAVVAGPFVRGAGLAGVHNLNISSVTVPNIFVSATIYRTDASPAINEMWLIANTPSPLPVQLTSFNVQCEPEQGVKIQWSTASEQNASHFTVEKTINFTDWTQVNEVPAHGNSNTENKYEFSDQERTRETVYYRLVQHDLNGASETFDPVSVICQPEGFELTVFPNPNQGNFVVQIQNSEPASESVLAIFDLNGRSLFEKQIKVETGVTHFPFNDLDLKPGTYVLKMEHNGKNKVVRFVVE